MLVLFALSQLTPGHLFLTIMLPLYFEMLFSILSFDLFE